MSDKAHEKLQALAGSASKYNVLLSSYSVTKKANDDLRQTVNALRQELSNKRATYAAEKSKLKSDMFDLRMKVEFEFMKAKRSMEEQYSKTATAKMKEEADSAVKECIELSSKLSSAQGAVVSSMKLQASKASALSSLRVSRSITEATLEMQQSEVELLERLMAEQSAVVARGQDEISKLHTGIRRLQKEEKSLSRATSKLNEARSSYAAAKAEKESWKKQVNGLVTNVEEWISKGCPVEETVGFIVGSAPSKEEETKGDESYFEWEEDENDDAGPGDEIWRASLVSKTNNNETDGLWRDPGALPNKTSLIY